MKKGDVKRGQILDAAERLFFERGYDHTAVQDILNATGLSKGGFYHYFDAKETVLREITERQTARRFERLGAELYNARRGAVDKVNLLLSQTSLFAAEDAHYAALMLKLCYLDRDASIRDHRRRFLTDRLTPMMNDAVAEGLREGALHTRHPLALGRVMLLMACDADAEVCETLAGDIDDQDSLIRVIELINAYRESLETLSGAPYGAIQLIDVQTFAAAYRAAVEELRRLEEIRA